MLNAVEFKRKFLSSTMVFYHTCTIYCIDYLYTIGASFTVTSDPAIDCEYFFMYYGHQILLFAATIGFCLEETTLASATVNATQG